ncbi:MAG: sodium:proton antiporter [Bacteroidetes bacterium]|nr:sodium:proton antiporter [Bacteroidota bacterium]
MTAYTILTILICLSAGFAYINHRFIRLPFVIGLFLLSTILSLLVLTARVWLPLPYEQLRNFVEQTDISRAILDVLLGFLLFAGALHTSWGDMRRQLAPVGLLAIGGVLVSTAIIGSLLYGLTCLVGVQVSLVYCLLFGAIISPTDPIAVIGILTQVGVPKKIETLIVAESLFNDGVGVVTFISLLAVAKTGGFDIGHFSMLFVQEAVGGVLFGLVLGIVLHYLMRSIDSYDAEVLLTIAFVMAGYSTANSLHISGALAMVVMGLLVGNYKHDEVMSDTSHEYVQKFWTVIDAVLNAILFILVAMVLVVIEFRAIYALIGVIAVVIVLFSRAVVVYIPHWLLPRIAYYNRKEARVIVWGGLRGGLSMAMALSLPESEHRHMILIATYCCVLFSIVVQGLTVGRLAKTICSVPPVTPAGSKAS